MLKKLFTVRNLVILLGVIALFVISGLLGLEVPAPEVFIAAETIFHIGSFAVTNALFTTWIVMVILIVIALITTRRYPKNLDKARTASSSPAVSATSLRWWSRGCTGWLKAWRESGRPPSSPS